MIDGFRRLVPSLQSSHGEAMSKILNARMRVASACLPTQLPALVEAPLNRPLRQRAARRRPEEGHVRMGIDMPITKLPVFVERLYDAAVQRQTVRLVELGVAHGQTFHGANQRRHHEGSRLLRA
jgi:hypothetical protein